MRLQIQSWCSFPKLALAIAISANVGHALPCTVLSDYLARAGTSSGNVFLRDFPYDMYLDSCGLSDLKSLEVDRRAIMQTGKDSDTFVSNLFSRYLERRHVNIAIHADVKRVVDLADSALLYSRIDGGREIYESAGYMLLDDLDGRARKAISNRQLTKNSPQGQYVVQVLAERNYHIGFPMSRLEKLITHINNKDWSYILDRAREELVQYGIFVSITFILLIAVALRYCRIRRRNVDHTITVHTSTRRQSLIMFFAMFVAATSAAPSAAAQTLNESGERQYGDMTIRTLSYGTQQIGSSIWIGRGSERIKAKYFASGLVYQRFSRFNEQIALACAGAFSEINVDGFRPEGLTVDDGTIINRDLNPDWEGLVIVYATGGIAVSDLRKGDLTLENRITLDLRHSPRDKNLFLRWAEENRATVFQTQLLATNDGLRLTVGNAQREFRERRFLAIVRDNRSNQIFHIIFDVPRPFYLGTLAKLVNDYLVSLRTTVFALLNLDTGDYDILQVNTPSGQRLNYLDGPKQINKATNLLVYYYSR